MKKLTYIFLIFTIFLGINEVKAQSIESKIALKEGNKTYKNGNYDTSLFNYQSSFLYDTSNMDAIYNKGNAALMSGNFEEARTNYNGYLQYAGTKIEKADAHYNIGNSYLSEYSIEVKNQQQPPNSDLLKSAVEEYKNSLRYNFNDEDARYNLSYAMKLLEQNKNQENKDQQNKDQQNKDQQNKDQQNKDQKNKDQQNKDQQNKDQQDKDQQNKDQQNKDQQNKDQQNKDQQNKDQQNKDQQNKNDKKPKEAQSKQQAMKNLDAINADEEKVLMKVNRKKGDQKKKSKSKDW